MSEGLGPNARKLASQLQNAAYNCGYEDAHPSNATTRQAKADAKCREVLAALYAECDRLAAAEAKTNSYIVDNARLAEQVENLRAALSEIVELVSLPREPNWTYRNTITTNRDRIKAACRAGLGA